MDRDTAELIDRATLLALRTEIGGGMPRLVGYFREDGAKSVAAVEAALRQASAVALVRPAHTLKGEALQFGAIELGQLAEEIEMEARDCVEEHRAPEALKKVVPRLRPLFERTVQALAREIGPAAAPAARPTFGRRTFGTAAR